MFYRGANCQLGNKSEVKKEAVKALIREPRDAFHHAALLFATRL